MSKYIKNGELDKNALEDDVTSIAFYAYQRGISDCLDKLVQNQIIQPSIAVLLNDAMTNPPGNSDEEAHEKIANLFYLSYSYAEVEEYLSEG